MADLSKEEMIKYIREVITDINDAIPVIPNVSFDGVEYCFNTINHYDYGVSVFYPPANDVGFSFPQKAVLYFVTNDGRVFVGNERYDIYNIEDCLGDTVYYVYTMLHDAYLKKIRATDAEQ